MDLHYLLVLQNLRNSLPNPVETFFVYLSVIGDGPILVALVLTIYWCIDKRSGQFSFIAYSSATFVSQFLKNIVCVYRPWIRDTAIVPAQASIKGAGGYSFPSGHAAGTASSIGSFAWLERKRRKAIAVICIVFIALMCFSRNFLGVHTPQDVLVGVVIALVAIALTQLFLNWIERCDAVEPGHNKDIIVMVVVIALCAASIVVLVVKPYPLDYVNGVLLVDFVEMQKGSFIAAGIYAGLSVSWVLERRFVDFSTEGIDTKTRLVRFAIGVIFVAISYLVTDMAFKAIMPYNWAKMSAFAIVVIVAVFVVPLVFSRIEQRAK